MMKKIIFIALFFCLSNISFAMTNAFYVMRGETNDNLDDARVAFKQLEKNYQAIDILISQAYQVDAKGIVWGHPNLGAMSFAKQHHIRFMVLLTNVRFDKDKAHDLLKNDKAQKEAIRSLVSACQHNHYYGVQLDFENIFSEDKDALTKFYSDVTQALHKIGVIVSYALPPRLTDEPYLSFFQKKVFENWQAAYDFQALGKTADFVTIMAYEQHGDGTTPGPVADIHWVEAAIQYALKYIPANKISLGIPVWSGYWFTDHGGDPKNPNKIFARHVELSYPNIDFLVKKYHVNLQWDDNNKVAYAIFNRNWLNEYFFIENAKSFSAKKALAEKYHLSGISVFAIGQEDPEIYKAL